MALSRRTGQRFQGSVWPGFVDAITGLLMVLTFVLTIFMVVQFVLRETISGREDELTALSDEIVLSSWQRFLEPKEPLICLVAEQGDRLVGLAHFIVHRNTITIENTAYLQDLFSDPSLRGKGIGRALIASFFEHACDAGIAQVYWHTHASNQTAMRLYDRVATNTGFTVYRKTLAI